jgi:hypothetical protein
LRKNATYESARKIAKKLRELGVPGRTYPVRKLMSKSRDLLCAAKMIKSQRNQHGTPKQTAQKTKMYELYTSFCFAGGRLQPGETCMRRYCLGPSPPQGKPPSPSSPFLSRLDAYYRFWPRPRQCHLNLGHYLSQKGREVALEQDIRDRAQVPWPFCGKRCLTE